MGELHLAVKYGQKAIQIGEDTNLSQLSIPAIGCFAKINMDNENYDESLHYFHKALQASNKNNRYIQRAYINKELAELYFYRNEFQLGMQAAQKAISISQKHNLYIIENEAMINLSWLYRATNQLDKALNTVNQVIDFLNEKKHAPLIIKAKISKALILCDKGQLDEAMALTNNTLVFAKENKFQKQIIQLNNSIAKLYGKKENYKNAFIYQQKAEQLQQELLKEEKAKIIQLAESNSGIALKQNQNSSQPIKKQIIFLVFLFSCVGLGLLIYGLSLIHI